MPNIASVLKDEITRIARKEVLTEVRTLRKLSAQHRSAIAALRRQVAELERSLRSLSKRSTKTTRADTASETAQSQTTRRFSAPRLAAHRAKLELSAASYGSLLGVSGASIYNWEQGKGRPSKAKLEELAMVRALSKAEAKEKVSQIRS